MAVYVDDIGIPATVGRFTSRWSHLIADTQEELHEFAKRLGLQRSWFQDPGATGSPAEPGSRELEFWHYDVTEGKRLRAIQLGAVAISFRDLPEIIDRRVQAREQRPGGLQEGLF